MFGDFSHIDYLLIFYHKNNLIFEARQEAPKFDILWQNMAENVKKIIQQLKTIGLPNYLLLLIF